MAVTMYSGSDGIWVDISGPRGTFRLWNGSLITSSLLTSAGRSAWSSTCSNARNSIDWSCCISMWVASAITRSMTATFATVVSVLAGVASAVLDAL
ncbi:hypothetical protein BDZ97DRAFT_1837811 [Flammula alnicola]|nr:hypothetical protein BDZ97DRAFT_1837811 [Flammula alnicola]